MKKEYKLLEEAKKVVLAYSGGLDTSVIVNWLKEQGVEEIICLSADLGQVKDVEKMEEKALKSGASKFINVNLEKEFIEESCFMALKANALYEDSYHLGTALARGLIGKELVKVYKKENADLIVHGCTGKGNDQIRFELAILAHDPDAKVIAPWRFWDIKSRSDEIKYLKDHNIEIDFKEDESYSEDENIWHISHEGLDLENPENAADFSKVLKWVKDPKDVPDEKKEISIEFSKGVPVKLDGKEYESVDLVKKLNKIGGDFGVGIDDLVESRLVGMKSRGLYENPAAKILYFAHKKLESVTLEKELLQYKQKLSLDYANLIYNGKEFSPLKKSMDAFINESQESVDGVVKLSLYKGNIYLSGIKSDKSLFSEELATFEEDDVYNQADATGFINLYGLSTKVHSKVNK